MSEPKELWVNPETGRNSCPSCDGFGYYEDGSDEGIECETCDGDGVATKEAAAMYLGEG